MQECKNELIHIISPMPDTQMSLISIHFFKKKKNRNEKENGFLFHPNASGEIFNKPETSRIVDQRFLEW